MANPKTLGPNPRPNARPLASVNQRPAKPAQTSQSSAISYGARQHAAGQRQMQQRPAQPAAPAVQKGSPAAKPVPQKRVVPPVQQKKKNEAVDGFVSMLRDMVGGFAILSEEVLQKNMALMAGNGLNYEDRTVSFECVDYLVSNLAYIFMGLVMDPNFKTSFMEALNVELQIDDMPANVKEQTRKQMKDTKQYKSNGAIVLGVTTFVSPIAEDLMKKMQDGFTRLDPYAGEFDEEVAKMPTEAKVELGFIFSNFMYLIRAFSHNDMFMSYVITVIEKVKGITAGAQ